MYKLSCLLLIFIIPIFIAATVFAQDESDVPHIDKAFLFTSELREEMVSNFIQMIQPFCNIVGRKRHDIFLAALESCELKRVVQSLEDSERELNLKAGELFFAHLVTGPKSEPAMWRYFIRIQMAKRVVKSISDYLEQGSAGTSVMVKGLSIPMLAGSLDRYSYWSRLINMQEAQNCDLSFTPGNLRELCIVLKSQLYTLGQTVFSHFSEIELKFSGQPNLEKLNNLERISQAIVNKLKNMTLSELIALENMKDVTSAGMGIPFFRQLVSVLQIQMADFSPEMQRQIQKTILLNELKSSVAQWPKPAVLVKVNQESVSRLENELKNLLTPES